MNIIIPMAGMGTRMRPHTLTVPKPLIPLAGKPIVHRLVEGIVDVCEDTIDEIAFVIGNFGEEVENQLRSIAESVGARASIYYQTEALGTAHAVWCAADSLKGKTVVAFADTLFFADFKIDPNADSIIWVQKVKNPEAYGVVTTNDEGIITGFEEKPNEFVSDLAIIGIYYFSEGLKLKAELQNLIDNNITVSGEYQLTTALENLRANNLTFIPGQVDEWLDCGNKDITVSTHQRVLARTKGAATTSPSAKLINSVVIEPCYIGDNVEIKNSVVGPYVSVGNDSKIKNSVIKNTVIQCETVIKNTCMHNSMIGNKVEYKNKKIDVSVGDYNKIG